jgi:hypothetical protein
MAANPVVFFDISIGGQVKIRKNIHYFVAIGACFIVHVFAVMTSAWFCSRKRKCAEIKQIKYGTFYHV